MQQGHVRSGVDAVDLGGGSRGDKGEGRGSGGIIPRLPGHGGVATTQRAGSGKAKTHFPRKFPSVCEGDHDGFITPHAGGYHVRIRDDQTVFADDKAGSRLRGISWGPPPRVETNVHSDIGNSRCGGLDCVGDEIAAEAISVGGAPGREGLRNPTYRGRARRKQVISKEEMGRAGV